MGLCTLWEMYNITQWILLCTSGAMSMQVHDCMTVKRNEGNGVMRRSTIGGLFATVAGRQHREHALIEGSSTF